MTFLGPDVSKPSLVTPISSAFGVAVLLVSVLVAVILTITLCIRKTLKKSSPPSQAVVPNQQNSLNTDTNHHSMMQREVTATDSDSDRESILNPAYVSATAYNGDSNLFENTPMNESIIVLLMTCKVNISTPSMEKTHHKLRKIVAKFLHRLSQAMK